MIVEQSLPASPMAAVRILMVAEKPRLAKSIARTLSNNSYDTWSELIGNTKSKKPVTSRVYEFDGEFQEKPAKFTITSTYGHLMDMDFYPEYNNWRRTTPEYIKNQLYTAPVKKVKRNPLRGIHEHLAKEAKDKDCLILWLDPDNEGENICFEVIYTVMGHMNISEDMKNVFRARLSSLAPDDITSAFHNLERPNMYKSWVVDVRRELDFRIGCAITRLFTIHIKPLFDKLKTEQLSYGPCQTPILGLCVGRHKEITNFKKESYWVLKAKFVSNKSPMEMQFSTGKINDKDTAQRLFGKIKDRGFGEVIKVEKKTKRDDPPCALNSPELMRAINKLYGTMPKDAMDFLEKLYLNEYVTYPRTGRTDYPQSFDIKDCLEKIARGNIEYKTARKLLESDITPVFNQTNSDQHDLSPIVPMNPYFGDVAPSENKKQIIGYVVKHFLATLMKPCDYEITTVTVQLGDETFTTTGVEVIEKGYTELFTWKAVKTKRIADVKKGDRLQLIAINRDEKCTAPPEHLTVSEIITAMVENNIGTNGSIATHIHSICDKGYVTIIDNRRLKPTKLGIALIDSFNNAAPELVYTELRRAIEEKLANAINPNKNSSYKTFDEIKYKTHVKEVFKEYKKILVDLIDNINEAVKAFEDKTNMADTVGTSALPEQIEGVVPGSVRGNRGRRRYYNNRRNTGNIQESRADQTSNIENSTTVSNMESGRGKLPNGAYHTDRSKEYRSSQNKSRNLHSQAENTTESHDIGETNARSAVTATNNAQRRGKPQFTRGYRNQTHRGQQDRQPKPQEKPRISHKFNPNAIPFVPPQPAVRLMNVVDLPNPTPVEYPKNNTVTRVNNNRRNHQGTNDASVSKHKVKSVPHNKNRHPKRVENINAPLRERLKNRLEDNDYECMICCQIITAKQGIWSCKKCYNMFHISGNCIINWARKSRQDDSEDQWRCPTCQTKYTQIPYNYYCFCGKDRNPSVQIGETPHSCGQVCGGVRGPGCPHPCSEPCHPGPCAECPVMVTQQCNCGKIEKTTRCGAGLQVSCDQVCDRLLSCRNHRCTKICHAGDCAPCEMRTQQKCYCQLDEKEVPCHSGDIYKYSCGRSCTGKYSCGVHDCNNRCHPKGKNCGHCVLAPERISRCPCGKYALNELGVEGIRTKCTDSIPTCESICNKILQCGSADKPHRCRLQCHTGPCPPCSLNSSIVCRCKQVKKTVPCIEYCEIIDKGEFLCERRCRKKKNCGVHRCNEVCCIQDVHICTVVCNKRLSCGLHNCEYLCHPGQCVRCLQASFEEQFCHCGRTMRPPPIPCGASLPVCDEPCARPHPCNHPVNHKCHALTVCPPCTYLVERECYGKHEIRKNIPCHIEGVSCGRECGKPMPCGVHTCNRRCHFGDCLKAGESCTQPCSTIRKGCEHPCNVKCHGLLECPNSPCEYPVTALCECGRRKETMRCHETEKIKQRLRAIAVEDEAELEDSAKLTLKRTKSMENLPILPCTDDCKKIARNKKLADALSIVTNDDGDTDSPMITFSETMKSGLKSYPQLVTELEKIFLKLIEALADPTLQTNVLSYNFTPMPMEKRRLIHEYASYFQLESLSVDEPPKRSVIVNGRRGVARPPLILLSDLQKYPSVLKYTGSTTLRQNVNDEIKKAAAAAEEEGNGMKQMRAQRAVYKRMPPKISVPAPIKQANAFAVLGSDDECDSPVVAPPVLNNQLPTQRDVDWWSDDDNDKNGIEEKPREEVAEQSESTVEEFGEIQNQEDLEEDKLEERSSSENL